MKAQNCKRSLVSLMALVAAGCTSSSQVASKYVKKQLVSAAQGGTLTVTSADSTQLAGTVVDIPAFALRGDTTITIGVGPADITPASATPVGPVVDLGPSGTAFTDTVKVTLPYTAGTALDHLFISVLEATGTAHRIENGSLEFPSGGRVRFGVSGFSEFQVGLDSPVPDAGPCPDTCPSNSSCDGVSQCLCDTGFTECASGPVCVNLGTDNNNCGSCGTACPTGFNCDFGDAGVVTGDGGPSCVCGAGTFQSCVSLTDGGSDCVDLANSSNNCGTCGTTCVPGAHCSNSTCSCDPGYDLCGSACVSLQIDNSNCGACNVVCDQTTGYVCSNGTCQCGAGAFGLCPLPDGGQVCSDPTTDPHNCGSCGNDCGALQCVNATCGCNTPLTECASGGPEAGVTLYCADLTTDNSNCGSCGNSCDVGGGYSCQSVPAGPFYVDGGLVDAGDAGVIYTCVCGGGGHRLCPVTSPDAGTSDVCTNTTIDPNNCGACGTTCASGSCIASTCQ
jgi:hypothetical protein